MSMCLTNSKEREQEEDWKALFEEADPRFQWNGAELPEGSRLWKP